MEGSHTNLLDDKANQALFDEQAANDMIISSLTAHIKKLERRLRRLSMVLKDSKNNLYLVPDDVVEPITEEMRAKLIAELQEEQAVLQQGNVAVTTPPQVG